jgi:hypothetical protein
MSCTSSLFRWYRACKSSNSMRMGLANIPKHFLGVFIVIDQTPNFIALMIQAWNFLISHYPSSSSQSWRKGFPCSYSAEHSYVAQKFDDLSGPFSTLLAKADILRDELFFIAPNKNVSTIADVSFWYVSIVRGTHVCTPTSASLDVEGAFCDPLGDELNGCNGDGLLC